MLTCRNLMDTDYFYRCFELCTGENGLDKRILWFYIDNSSSEQKLRFQKMNSVGNLIFVNMHFVKREMSEQLSYLYQCVKNNAAGLVIAGVNSWEISGRLIQEAESKNMPIFSMESRDGIYEVTKTIARMIIQEENKEEYKTIFMSEILSGKLDSIPMILSRGHECGIDLTQSYCFLSLKIDIGKENSASHTGRYYLEVMHQILPKIEYLCTSAKTLKYFSFERGVCLFSLKEPSYFARIRGIVDEYLRQYNKESRIMIKAGYSNLYSGAENLEIAYEESQEAMQAAMKASVGVISIEYDELSILRFITVLSKDERRKIIDVAKKRLEPILNYDRNNNTDLLNTCYEYLRSDSNLLEASQNLYIHRNTLMKRLKKIEELLSRDLKDFQVKWDAYNSIYILKYFDII